MSTPARPQSGAPPGRRTGPLPTDPSSVEVATTDSQNILVPAAVLRAAAQLVADAGERVEQAERLGRTEGYADGRDAGYRDGYRDGFAAGHDVGASRVLIHGPVPALSSSYTGWRARLDTEPTCPSRCGRCSACVRMDAVEGNRERYGSDDFPGTAMTLRRSA